jgi:hypothetical protein
MASGISGRSRRLAGGPGRRLAIVVFVGLSAFVGVTFWRMRSLDGLPDVGDPFDVAEALRPVEIPDADNAFVAYAAARRELVNSRNPYEDPWCSLVNAVWDGEIKSLTWSSAAPGIREYLEAKRAALEIWREGSRRRDALHHQPARMTSASGFPSLQDTIALAGLAALEGSRLEDAGAKDEVWDWYRSMLRSSRLVGRHGSLNYRYYGERIHALAVRCILRWASDPTVDAARLRRALGDTLAADALTLPVSDAIKLDYLILLGQLEDLGRFESMTRDFGRPLP